MSKRNASLAVVEGKWSNRTNVSVKSLFDVLSDITFSTPHAYIYEMFCDAASLTTILSSASERKGVKYVYVGAHGNDSGISASGGKVSRSKLKNALAGLKANSLDGLFLGSCLFGSEGNSQFLLRPNNGATPIKWLAGYTTEVDWIDSSVLDMLFWHKLFKKKGTANQIIKATAADLKRLAPGLISDLGFHIYTRRAGKNSGIQDLLA